MVLSYSHPTILLVLLPLISCTSFYVLNDIHFDPNYNANLTPNDNLCRGNTSQINFDAIYEEFPILKTSHHLYENQNSSEFGQFGCDSPYQLVTIMLDQVLKNDASPDIIYLPGDFVGHGYSQDPTSTTSNQTYNVLLDILYNISQEIKIRFPDTLIVPAVGNNDPEFHYQVPDTQDKIDYYEFLFQTWFIDHVPNSKLPNLDEIKSTFLDGGYYRADFSDELSVFSLNTLYFSKKNSEDNDPQTAEDQLNWLKTQLTNIKNNEPQRKVIITYHILPGYKYNGSGARMWNDSYVVEFDSIVQQFNDILVTIVAAHTHSNSLRSYKLETSSGFLGTKPSYGTTIVCPSVTPIYLNNPGFTLIDLENASDSYAIESVKFTYLNLQKLNQDVQTKKIEDFSGYFFDILVEKEYSLSDYSSDSLGNFIGNLKDDDDLFLKFLIYSLGFPLEQPYYDQALNVYQAMGLVSSSSGSWDIVKSERGQFICILKHMKQDDYQACKN